MAEYRVLLRTEEAMLRKAMRIYLWRRHFRRPRTAAAWVIMLAVGIAMVASDGFTFLSGAVSATLAVTVLFVAGLWRAQVAATIGRYRRMDPPEVELTLRDTDITISSSLNAVTVPWPQFTETWFLPRFWMLFTTANQFTAIPTETMAPDALAFLRAHVPGGDRAADP